MKDSCLSDINYIRISLTDKCNLRCVYCMDEDEKFEEEYINDILSFDDYKFIIKNFAELGIKKIKFDGGEPLLYGRLSELIYYAKHICNIEDVSITTNGHNFCERALELKESGIDSVNISIDSLKEYRYRGVTRGGNLNEVLNTFNTCLRLKIPVKINCTLIESFNDDEVFDFIQLAKNFPVDVRFVELRPSGYAKELYRTSYINTKSLIESIDGIEPIESDFNSIAKYYTMRNLKGRIGVISSISNSFFKNSNRIRITHDGYVRLCLHGEEDIDIKQFLHKPIMFKEIIKEILLERPRTYTSI
ncbi:GTP 3',8-cyclase MoaA [Terrisporobacter sp.]|uniref:GTP 3',8-cyclase MoaA n=1 Tax=Terrisporobacter sp. TaxID=1965305 RepID=UPI00262074BD|nr:radical SAM protein [Terrisporobacter sp.]